MRDLRVSRQNLSLPVVARGSDFSSNCIVEVPVKAVGQVLTPSLPFPQKLSMSRAKLWYFIFRVSLLAFINIRYGLVARISRSQTVFLITQLGPRRPGFNSPCRNQFLLVSILLVHVVGSEMRPKNIIFLAKPFGVLVDADPNPGVGGFHSAFYGLVTE
jgi:hypothetical protein